MDTPHKVHYVAGLLHWVRCSRCEQGWVVQHVPLAAAYCKLLPERVASKPFRVGLEIREHPLRFATRLPHRAFTKPLRLLDEAVEVVGLNHQ